MQGGPRRSCSEWPASQGAEQKGCTNVSTHGGPAVKNPPASTGDMRLIPELGRSSGGGNDNPLQYSCLENSIDRGAWRATVHGVTHIESDMTERLSLSSFSIFLYSLGLQSNFRGRGWDDLGEWEF